MRSELLVLVVLILAGACSRFGSNADSAAAAESARAAAPGAATAAASASDTSRAQPAPDSATRAGASTSTPARSAAPKPDATQRPSPANMRPNDTRPSIPANPPQLPVSQPNASRDTARGKPAVVGTSFQKQVVLQPEAGGRPIPLAGPQAPLIGAQSGADVWVVGTRDASGTLTVSRFVVRSVDGAAAVDGVLRTSGKGVEVVTADGTRHPVASPPPPLRQLVGARVWVTGAASGPVVFGVIQKNP